MKAARKPRIKICCIGSVDEMWTAVEYGAAAVGLVSAMPSGPGVISEDLIARISRRVPPPVSFMLLTCEADAGRIIAQQRRVGVNALQLCDRLGAGSHEELRRALPGVAIIQVIHVTGPEAIAEAVAIARRVDAILLDSGNQSLPIKELGGTGRTHDWEVSRRIRETVDVPVFLAGGLNPSNIAEALRAVEPFGVDVCTGVRTNGLLDEAKLAAFMDNAAGR